MPPQSVLTSFIYVVYILHGLAMQNLIINLWCVCSIDTMQALFLSTKQLSGRGDHAVALHGVKSCVSHYQTNA